MKECEHEDIDTQEIAHPNSLETLRNYGLLKFFLTLGKWALPELLLYLISLSDINQEIVIINDEELELETLDIYFIERLSQRGELVNLYALRLIGGSVNMLHAEHCLQALKSKSGKIKIMTIWDLMLRVLLFTINRVVVSQAPNELNKSNF